MRQEAGVTMMELIVIIVVLGLAVPGMMSNLAAITVRSTRSEAMADATLLAGELMEEVKSKAFIDPAQPNNTILGPNGSEAYPDFNDVDDYNGYTRSWGPYALSVAVQYASLTGDSWAVSAGVTDFKQITVRVVRGGTMADTSVTAIVAEVTQ